MNCELINQTPLPAQLHPYTDSTRRRWVVLIAKSTWRLDNGRLAPPEQQISLFNQPQRRCLGDFDLDAAQRRALGDREQEETVWLDHDLTPPKPQFDLLVAGYVTPPANHRGLMVKAGVQVESRQAILEAHVPRFWLSKLSGHTPEPSSRRLHRVPICHAFADWSGGFPQKPELPQPQQLPWLQRPGSAYQRKHYDEHPAGFGYWPESAPHRHRYSGTYDEAWERERMPDLPVDFDARFYNVAHPDLQWPQAPLPGTKIHLIHLAEMPRLNLTMPELKLVAQATAADGTQLPSVMLKPDTLTLEPDHNRMTMVHRATLPEAQGAHALSAIRLVRSRSVL
jgi:hypothetical protein